MGNKNLPHEIILNLFKKYYTSKPNTALNDLFKKFSIGNTEKARSIQIKNILKTLEAKKYIIYSVSRRNNENEKYLWHESYKEDFATDNKDGFYDLNNTLIMGLLTPDGVDYAIDIDRKKVQHNNNRLAIFFAGLTVFLSVTSLYKTIISQKELNNKQQQLQMQLQSSDSLQRIYQNQMNYILGKMAKDSLKTSKK